MTNPFKTLKDLIHSLEDDFDKSYDKKNSAAGTRVRKGMQELKNHAQAIRLEVQNMKNDTKAAAAPAAAKKAPAVKKAAPVAKKSAPAKAAPAKKK